MLELDNDLYNIGIVDKSHLYKKELAKINSLRFYQPDLKKFLWVNTIPAQLTPLVFCDFEKEGGSLV